MATRRPILLTVGIFGSILVALLPVVFHIFVLYGPEVPSYRVNDQEVSREAFQEFYTSELLPKFAWMTPGSILLLFIAFAFWREKEWARPVVMAYWMWGVFAQVIQSDFLNLGNLFFTLVMALIPLAIASYYFYGNSRVVEYYASISREE